LFAAGEKIPEEFAEANYYGRGVVTEVGIIRNRKGIGEKNRPEGWLLQRTESAAG